MPQKPTHNATQNTSQNTATHADAVMAARRKQARENMDAGLDFRPAGKLSCRYLICSTERSGSSLLADMLSNTGMAGRPMEYFNKLYVDTWNAGASPSLEAYLSHLQQRRTTPNGIFGVKAHLRQVLRVLGEQPLQKLPGLFRQFDKFIYIERRNKLAQAVSLARARSTGLWNSKYASHIPPAQAEPQFNPGTISRALDDIIGENKDWQNLIASHGLDVRKLFYEDLAADPQGTVSTIVEWLGGDITALPQVATSLSRQRDRHSDDFAARFLDYINGTRD